MTLSPDRWLRRLGANPQARLRLFCLPYAGGGTAQYRPWARLLPPEVEPYALCLPGREERINERPVEHMEPLLTAMAQALQPLLDRPFVLYGHSLGGLLGFELAHTLRRIAGVEPARLIVSGRGAPESPPAPAIGHLPDAAFVAALNQRYGGIPQAVLNEPELLALFLPVLRGDFRLLEGYSYKARPPLSCPITAVGGAQDSMVTADALHGWRPHTQGALTTHLLEGAHFFIQSHQGRFLEVLSAELRRTPESASARP